MMMMIESEVPKAIFSFDVSMMDSQNSESCYIHGDGLLQWKDTD